MLSEATASVLAVDRDIYLLRRFREAAVVGLHESALCRVLPLLRMGFLDRWLPPGFLHG
jgi:hypothetical protein